MKDIFRVEKVVRNKAPEPDSPEEIKSLIDEKDGGEYFSTNLMHLRN